MLRIVLRDDQWEKIETISSRNKGKRGRSMVSSRQFSEAVIWIACTGSPWRDLLEEFGSWNTAYVRFARWSQKNVWQDIFVVFREDVDFEEVYLDSTVVRAHQHGSWRS
jgi:transposase